MVIYNIYSGVRKCEKIFKIQLNASQTWYFRSIYLSNLFSFFQFYINLMNFLEVKRLNQKDTHDDEHNITISSLFGSLNY
jgi:hypothetical protein